MRLLKILALLSVQILLVGCPPKQKILYLKVVLEKQLKTETFLKQIGNKIEPPVAEKLGLDFSPERCEHRATYATLFGTCLVDKEVYIYAVVTDFGPDPQAYLGEELLKEPLSLIGKYKNNLDQLLTKLDISIQKEEYFVKKKDDFVNILKSKIQK